MLLLPRLLPGPGQGGGIWKNCRGASASTSQPGHPPAVAPLLGRQSAPCETPGFGDSRPASPQQLSRLGPCSPSLKSTWSRTSRVRRNWHNEAKPFLSLCTAFAAPVLLRGLGGAEERRRAGGGIGLCAAPLGPVELSGTQVRLPPWPECRDHKAKGPINATGLLWQEVKQLYYKALKCEPFTQGL